jgi:hypothetical protein
MAVIIRERRTLGGVETDGVRVFKSERPVTAIAQEQAERLDGQLAAEMTTIQKDLRSSGLLDKRGKAGVLELWWELGRRLQFLDSLEVSPAEDRKYIWRALYDHGGELIPGDGRSRAERYENSHFRYCYLLGRFDWPFVRAAGDWTSWVEFFDSSRIRQDERIIGWLKARSHDTPTAAWKEFTQGTRQAWFRLLAKAIRNRFKTRDSTVLSEVELNSELDDVFDQVTTS